MSIFEKISQQDVETLLKNKRKEIFFNNEIDELKSGEAIKISAENWKSHTKLSGSATIYYNTKLNTKDKKVVKVAKVGDNYIIQKI